MGFRAVRVYGPFEGAWGFGRLGFMGLLKGLGVEGLGFMGLLKGLGCFGLRACKGLGRAFELWGGFGPDRSLTMVYPNTVLQLI